MTRKKFIKITAQGIFIILFIAVAFYFADLARGDDTIKNMVSSYGYLGMFILSVISGFNLIVPIPAISFLPLFLESGLNFWLTIIIISFGMTVADSIVYLLGDFGRKVMANQMEQKVEKKLEKIREQYPIAPLIILFLFAAFIPLPNELFLIPLAFLGYRFFLIMTISFAGSVLFNLLYAYSIVNLFYLF